MQRDWIVEKDLAYQRIDHFAYAKGISRKAMKDIKMKGKIFVNDREQNVRYLLQEEDHLVFIFPQEEKGMQMIKEDIPLSILYEDDEFLVVDKPQGMPCIPNHTYTKHTLAQGLLGYYDRIGLDSTIHLVNRLDKETSGLLLVAKHRDMHHYFCQDIKLVERHYYALVKGHLSLKEGTIDAPITRDAMSIKRYIDASGKRAITHYRVIQEMEDVSLVECILETGRTHQIRVHMAHIGHPLKDDPLYDPEASLEPMYLDSVYLSFIHPLTHQKIEIQKNVRFLTKKD